MELFFMIIVLLVVAIGGFYVVCHIVKIWTGCDTNEAVKKVQNFWNGTANIDFTTDVGFIEDIWSNVRNVIGERRYNQLVKLSDANIGVPLLSNGKISGLPYVAICLFYADDSEKKRLESVLTNVIQSYLRRFGYDTRVFVNWKHRFDLDMPFLELRYAKTREQKLIMNDVQLRSRNEVITMNADVVDDTEDDLID